MKMNKKIKVIIAIILSISFIQIAQPVSLGKDLTNAEQAEKIMKDGVVLYVGSNVSYVNNTKSKIDAQNQDIFPSIKGERTIVPIRFIAENMGMTVTWDEGTQTATLTKGDKTIKLTVNEKKMYVNGKEVVIDVAPEIISERTFVPLRAIVEAFGKNVFWDRGLIIVSDGDKNINATTQRAVIDEMIAKVDVLPTVDSFINLKGLLSKIQSSNRYMLYDTAIMKSADQAMTTNEAATPSTGSTANDYSKTNVQVEGVDEADVVKTDGEYIYQVNGQKVAVIKAYPSEEMKVVAKLEFDDKNFNPQEMYVDSKNLIVIGNTYKEIETKENAINKIVGSVSSVSSKVASIMPPYYRPTKTTTKAIIFDLSDKINLKKVREVEVEGNYTSSRKIGSSMYIVTNKWINTYNLLQEEVVPCYRDTALKDEYVDVPYNCIHYFPGFAEANYMIVAGVNLDDSSPVSIYSYLGAGNNVYASTENLYVAAEKYDYESVDISGVTDGVKTDYVDMVSKTKTLVYKFSLQNGNVSYASKGEVPGTILNQFSMDENNGYFRIATTVGDTWRNDQYTSKNNVYVLDKTMNITGKIEDIAPGERIYSTRFMGDRLYMVTFKQVDPLFVIDLKDPTNPNILGKLKIPGYSEYLHPYDENHIIGFGKDTVDSKTGQYGLYLGMKIAMFDVTDVSNPIEMFKENIGDRGTYSELLNNHKALLFSKEKNLLAFPVTLMTVAGDKNDQYGNPKYGTFSYQGLYVYNIDLVNGFKLRGTITHMTDEELKKAGNYWYDYYDNVERGLYIKDVLYTLSKGTIKANDINSLKELKSAVIEKNQEGNGNVIAY